MAQSYPCDICGANFESLDDWAAHHHDKHDLPEGSLELSFNLPEKSQSQDQTLPQQVDSGKAPPSQSLQQGQQVENPIRPLMENPDDTKEVIDTIFERWQESQEQGLAHKFRLILVVALLFLAVLIASSYLTQQQILPSSAYTLLLGTIIGYLLTFLEDYL